MPLSAFLAGVLRDWLAVHPGGPYLFCNAAVVPRSRKRSRTTGYQVARKRPTTAAGRRAAIRLREGAARGPAHGGRDQRPSQAVAARRPLGRAPRLARLAALVRVQLRRQGDRSAAHRPLARAYYHGK